MRVPRTLDIECYHNYFLVRIEDRETAANVWCYELTPGGPEPDRQALCNLLATSTIGTFNGVNYDVCLLVLFLCGFDNAALKQASDFIIVGDPQFKRWDNPDGKLKWWDLYRFYGVEIPDYLDHIDLMEVAPGVRIGLKMYGGRMHVPYMQDLPIDPTLCLTPQEMFDTNVYCGNDHVITRTMWNGLKDRLALRVAIGEQYGIDVRSKSDAQIAEAVIKARLGFKPVKRKILHGYTFKYVPPANVTFATPAMRELFDLVKAANFVVQDKETAVMMGDDPDGVKTGVVLPAELAGRDVKIGAGVYRMGIGGLHSQESSVAYCTVPCIHTISDHDVASYYPSLILAMEMYPEQLGPDFLMIYRDVYTSRLAAKAAGEKVKADGLKIVLNGTFGKLFSKYSILFAPEFGIRTTITGQLYLLMLIEMLELSGITVLSANTDGIVIRTPFGMESVRDQVIAWWEKQTGMGTEATFYDSIFMRDVNNYIAFGRDGKIKRKGTFGESGLTAGTAGKHPDKDICADAVVQYLKDRTPVSMTIRACRDIRKFLVVRGATGGANYYSGGVQLQYLGKAVRWYYSTTPGYIGYTKTGNKVAGSEFAVPIMRLPEHFPNDVDYQKYIDVAEEMLENIGFGLRI